MLLFAQPLMGQGTRLWVLRPGGEMAEYDPLSFAAKQTVKVPAEAVQSPQNVSVNQLGQILFAAAVSLPLAEGDAEAAHKVWFWNGQAATMIEPGVTRASVKEGSNFVVTETAPVPYLSADGKDMIVEFAAISSERKKSDATLLFRRP